MPAALVLLPDDRDRPYLKQEPYLKGGIHP